MLKKWRLHKVSKLGCSRSDASDVSEQNRDDKMPHGWDPVCDDMHLCADDLPNIDDYSAGHITTAVTLSLRNHGWKGWKAFLNFCASSFSSASACPHSFQSIRC